jgi:hypothetical protein
MTDAGSLAKIIILLGIVFFFVSALYPGQDTAWVSFRNTLSGQGFPVFSNPFTASQLATVVQKPTAASNPNKIESTTGCTLVNYFQCISSNTNVKFLTLNASDNGLGSKLGGYFNVAMTNVTGVSVLSSTVTVWCRSNGTTSTGTIPIGIDNIRPGPTFVRAGIVSPTCNQGAEFLPLRFPVSLATGGFPVAPSTWNNVTYLTGAGITLKLGVAAQKVDVSYIEVQTQIDLGGNTACTSVWDMGCQLSRLVDPVVKFFQLIGNAIFFGVQLIIWIGTIIFTLGLGLIGTFGFILNLPGAPPIVSSIISIIVLGFMGFILLVIIKIFRGSSP